MTHDTYLRQHKVDMETIKHICHSRQETSERRHF